MEHTKRCTRCNDTLSIANFYRESKCTDGYRGACKVCEAVSRKARMSTPKGAKARRKSLKRYTRTDKYKAKQGAYLKRRKANLERSTPPWAPVHMLAAVYAEAERLTLESGVKHEVHHIMPIMEFGSLFVGLHVPWNLEILSVEEHTEAHIELRRTYSRAASWAKKMHS